MSNPTPSPEDHPADPVNDARHAVLDAMLMEAAFDGWTEAALARAHEAVGDDAPSLAILFPGGVRDALDEWSAREDAAMLAAYGALEPPPGKIRDKITWLVRQRIEGLLPHREAARRAAAVLALPIYAGLGPKLAWRSAGQMWRALGDTSLDGNFYSKRATLTGVYLSTLTRWFADEAAETGGEATWTFLDDRISNVMQFEKIKAQAKDHAPPFDAALKFAARLRYGDFGRP